MKSLFKRKMKETGRVRYMIDVSYGEKDWQMSSGIREILANMLDTKTESEYYYNKDEGYCVIKDTGTGLPKKALVMGASTKSSDRNSIGQFGEGLKMSLVTALRLNRVVSIRTMGYGVEITKEHSSEYGCDMMCVIYTDNSCEIGTEVRMECTEDEFNSAVNMFLQFQSGYKELDKNLYLPGGYVSILGLTTEERPNMLFSYDLDDKSLTNRDRNVIKTRQLKSEMEKILSGMKSKEAITFYLDNLTENPESEEYKIAFEPRSKKSWLKTIHEIYGDNVVFSSSSDGDIKAIYKGMKVIPCPTKQVRSVFTAIGLKSSAQKTKAVKNESVQIKSEEDNKIVYPIARNYVEDWTVKQAGRELVANALDMSPDATVTYNDGYCVIEDKGKGIERRHFVIGNSEKKDNEIGMFGEGFKMASLVLARENRDMKIQTVGTTYTPALEMSKEFGTEIFCFYYEKNNVKQGTKITFKSTEKEVNDIKNLFISFNEDVKIFASNGAIDLLDDGKGDIYVNGLCSTTIKSLFTYHIKGNKTLVDSRDRNHIDDGKLNLLLKEFYDTTSDTNVIDKVLTGWEKDIYFREYSLVLEPQMSILWYSEVEKCYPNCCLASMMNWKANFVAEQAGYRILKNVPPYILQVLSKILKTADEILNEIGDSGIMFDNKILFPITTDYIPNWKTEDALKEFISNALDASVDKVSAEWENGMVKVEDDGRGLKRENLLIGNSSSREIGSAIGNFGEGMKLACLTIAKKGIPVTIETVGFTIIASVERNPKFNADILVMNLSENERKKGTLIKFKTDEKTVETAKNLFLVFDENKERIEKLKDVYTGGKNGVYVNGALIYNIKSVGYSYNFTDSYAKQILSRDRKAFNDNGGYYKNSQIVKLMFSIKDENFIKNMIQNIDDDTEEAVAIYNAGGSIVKTSKDKWRKLALEVFPDACLPSYNAEHTLIAQDANFQVLTNINNAQKRLLELIGFPRAEEAMKMKEAKEKREEVIPKNKLSEEERAVLERVEKMVASEFGASMPSKIKIVACLDDMDGAFTTLGEYNRISDTVFLIRSLLRSQNIVQVYGIAYHEFEHRRSGAHDRTREFENALTDSIGGLLERIYQ